MMKLIIENGLINLKNKKLKTFNNLDEAMTKCVLKIDIF